MKTKGTQVLLISFFLFTIALIVKANDKIESEDIPSPQREMRAVWVATVDNIDWPSEPGLSVEVQKEEAIEILDRVKALNMNAVILQVRAHADAFYQSELEPWSYYLTGEQGKAPGSFYDPLEFWIEESHNCGLELHAWFNPYRANHPAMKCEIAPSSIVKLKPHCVRKLGNDGYYWMDPSMQEVQDHSYAVVMDVVERYDVDGIHFDDYFYPYTQYNDGKDFPDDETYEAYKKSGGTMSRGDWRRDAVNKFIKRIYDGIKEKKLFVKFGISPFGVYRPGFPPGIAEGGFDQYETLYADAKLWLNKGWCDYFTPQLYFPISRVNMSYPVILGWWNSENTQQRNLWPGLFIRPNLEKKAMALEIVNQVMVERGMNPSRPGTIIFSMQSLISKDSAASIALSEGPFKNQTLIPSFTWLDDEAPAPPKLNVGKENDELKIEWQSQGEEKPFLYVLYLKDNDKWSSEVLPGNSFEISKKIEDGKITAIAVSAVDRCGNESEKSIVIIE